MDVKSSGVSPALQYLDDVDKGSVADLAGLRKGDYLLAVCVNFAPQRCGNYFVEFE